MALEHFDLGPGMAPHPWDPALGRAWLDAVGHGTFTEFTAMDAAGQQAELRRVVNCLWNASQAFNIAPSANQVLENSLRRDVRAMKAGYWAGWAASLGHGAAPRDFAHGFVWPNAPGPRRETGGTPTPISVPGPLGGLVPFRAVVPPKWWELHPVPHPPLVPGTDVYDPAICPQARTGEIPQGYLREETTALGWDARPVATSPYGLILVDVSFPVQIAADGARDYLGQRASLGAGTSATWASAQPADIPDPQGALYFLDMHGVALDSIQRLQVVPQLSDWWSALRSAADDLRAADPRVLLISSAVLAASKTAYAMLAWQLGSADDQAAAHQVLARAYAQQDAVFATRNTTYALAAGAITAVVTTVNPLAGAIVGAAAAVGGAVLSLFEHHTDTRIIDYYGRREPVLEHVMLFDPGTFEFVSLPTPVGYLDPGELFPGGGPPLNPNAPPAPRGDTTGGSSAGTVLLAAGGLYLGYKALRALRR